MVFTPTQTCTSHHFPQRSQPTFQQLLHRLVIMATSVNYNASSFLLEPLPNLDIAARHTTSHALHRIHFVGALQPWANFKTEVAGTYNNRNWNGRVIASRLSGNFLTSSVHEERVFVCDERGIQGRLEGRAGTTLGAVFEAQNEDLKLSAFKGALPPYPEYKKAPDFVLLTQGHIAKVLGEAKVSWIREHHLEGLVHAFETGNTEEPFRHALGPYSELLIENSH